MASYSVQFHFCVCKFFRHTVNVGTQNLGFPLNFLYHSAVMFAMLF